jgi:hypothetical protein
LSAGDGLWEEKIIKRAVSITGTAFYQTSTPIIHSLPSLLSQNNPDYIYFNAVLSDYTILYDITGVIFEKQSPFFSVYIEAQVTDPAWF